MIRKLRRLAELPFPELVVLLQLVTCAMVMDAVLHVFSLPQLVRGLSKPIRRTPLRLWPLCAQRCSESRALALADIATTETHGHRRCLIRSLLVFWLLQAVHKDAQLFLGVRKIPIGLEGHAWIELHGQVIQDTPDMIARFTPVLRFETP